MDKSGAGPTSRVWGKDLLVVFTTKVFISSVDGLHEQLEYKATDKNHLSPSKMRYVNLLSKGFGKPWVTNWSCHMSWVKCKRGLREFLTWTSELPQ